MAVTNLIGNGVATIVVGEMVRSAETPGSSRDGWTDIVVAADGRR